MILADIGNRHVHIWDEGRIAHLGIQDAIAQYGTEKVYYITVNARHAEILAALENWRDISELLVIEGEYAGMGADRKALCLSHATGLFVDAGSAITVDRVVEGVYQGGYILPGIHAYQKAYAAISPVLDVEIERSLSLNELPKSTQSGVSYGIITPIVASIEKTAGSLPVYCTGADGAWIAHYLEKAVYDETLLFQGMLQASLKIMKKVETC